MSKDVKIGKDKAEMKAFLEARKKEAAKRIAAAKKSEK